ncbi:DNA/RNA non-specific endonuclease [Prevotella sp. KH2C16]|uniref:DNA/RNA non-specific endonuclease n=1 Tax=Prevotella sp. KH2C16 TaxID=1855325 RepID=UPI0008EA585A|nr:DNA/RNA non-specific endonuclease [Prevotella sp. KH2C16]SFG16818.1 endonuclease G [Prevotella sp. KH2C16]
MELRTLKMIVLAAGIMLLAACGQSQKPQAAIGRMAGLYESPAEPAQAMRPRLKTVTKFELPVPLKDRPEQILTRMGYTVSYNRETKTPNWVAWHLTRQHTYGRAQRSQEMFTEDESVDAPRATDQDYYNSRYDRGHMCPAGDNKWDENALRQSFLFTNICPQNHNLNRYEWNDIEILCRSWAREYGSVDVVCGPVFSGERKTIGRNKVRVPDAFFKVVLCRNSGAKAIGFVYQNTGKKQNVYDCIRTVDEIERLTGIDFFPALDDRTEERVEAEARIKSWNPAYPERYH